MPLPPHAEYWMSRAEIDYVGPFVKAWAAFNAWYRHASGEAQERPMLEYVKVRLMRCGGASYPCWITTMARRMG